MLRRFALAVGVAAVTLGAAAEAPAQAPQQGPTTPLNRYYYYPYTYFQHNYWPANSPQWPEQPGQAYVPPPAYMALPPYKPPAWRFEYAQPLYYYRGSHFWLDVF
jgi:hypothetical protein